MVAVHDTPSACAFQMYEVSSKYLMMFASYKAQRILAGRQKQEGKQYVPSSGGGGGGGASLLH